MTVECYVCNRDKNGKLTNIRKLEDMTEEERSRAEIELTMQFAEAMGFNARLIEKKPH